MRLLSLSHLQPHRVVIAPDGCTIAVASKTGCIYAVRMHTNEYTNANVTLFASSLDSIVRQVAFSPDGQLLVGEDSESIYVWSWSTGELLRRWSGSEGRISPLLFSRDSRHVISTKPDGTLCTWEVGTSVQEELLRPPMHADIVDAHVDVERNFVAVVTSGMSPQVIAYRKDSLLELWRCHGWSQCFAVSPDGRHIAITSYDQQLNHVKILDVETGTCVRTIGNYNDAVTDVAWNEDGLLYAWTANGSMHAWDVERCTERWSMSMHDWMQSSAGQTYSAVEHSSAETRM